MYEIKFQKLNKDNLKDLRALTEKCPFLSTAYCAGQRLMWQESYVTEFAVESGYVIIRIWNKDRLSYLFPYPLDAENGEENSLFGGESLDAVFDKLDEHTEDAGQLLRFIALDDEQIDYLCKRYKSHRLNTNRLKADYLYLTEDLAGFAGRRYSAQRNHIKHFITDWPGAVFRHLQEGDCEKVSAFFAEFESAFTKQSDFAKKELAYAKEYMLSECECPSLSCCVELDGRIIAVCAGERYGDCIDVQIEKCLPGFNGCYPFVVNEFAKVCLSKAKYMNREDDAADAGLRTSKTQYHPIRLVPNSDFGVTGELTELAQSSDDFLGETGDLISMQVSSGDDAADMHSLSLTHILDSDSDDYDRLCLDDEHNRLWGYDYKKDIPSPTPGCFLGAARKAFAAGSALSLAIRLDGKFIGEAVYFVVDGRGSAKLGWRLLPEFCGKGLAASAFKLAGDFGLYTIGFAKLKAYCYRENEASANSIAHSMKQVGEDEKFIYFERTL